MADPVVLKKYGNRRLYDTTASRYVTLTEVEDMVQRGTDIEVRDAKTGDDLTKEVLVQLILERDGAREMLPAGFLKQIVRLSQSPLREGFARLLHDTLHVFLQGYQSGQRTLTAPLQQLQQLQQQQLQQMQQAQLPSPLWNPFAAFGGAPPTLGSPLGGGLAGGPANLSSPAAPANQAAADDEMSRLRQDVSETQALLRELLAQKSKAPAAHTASKADAHLHPPRAARRRTRAKG